MKNFVSVNDVEDLASLLRLAQEFKARPFSDPQAGKDKTLGLIFFNPSLRTRLSTQKAGLNLGMNVMIMNFDKEGWALETEDGVIMNGNKAEHIREGAAVMGQYCDIIGIRSFAALEDREQDYRELMINGFLKYAGIPVINLESAVLHPLQSLTDLMTIEELKKKDRPKVVLSWAPHVRPLPQAVPNSFAQWMNRADVNFVITHPPGYELAEEFSQNTKIEYSQDVAFEDADFVYVKNWSSYKDYGKIISSDAAWMITADKMNLTNEAKFMHCLPVRRNVVVHDEVLDGPHSVVIQQAGNRLFAAQAVLKMLLEEMR